MYEVINTQLTDEIATLLTFLFSNTTKAAKTRTHHIGTIHKQFSIHGKNRTKLRKETH